jgi:hypothetical protein
MVSLLKKLISPHSASSPYLVTTDCSSELWPSHIGTNRGLWRELHPAGAAAVGARKRAVELAYLAPLIDDVLQRKAAAARRTIRDTTT